MGDPLRLDNLAAGLPVAWAKPSNLELALVTGHPGLVSDECVGDDAPCEVGVDIFVHWYRRPRASQLCFEFSDVEVISRLEYDTRVSTMDREGPAQLGLPPASDDVARRIAARYGHEVSLVATADAFNDSGAWIDVYLDGVRVGAVEFTWDEGTPLPAVLRRLEDVVVELCAEELGSGL